MLVERDAYINDSSFISSCVLYGARKGHYSFNAGNPEMVAAMKREIHSLLTDGLLSDKRRAMASIYTVKGERVAMLIMCEVAPDSMGYEIYALSVVKKHQHKGYASEILDRVIKHFLYDDIYARCLPVSVAMKKLLTARGFALHGEDGEYETYVKDGFNCCDVVEPMVLSYS